MRNIVLLMHRESIAQGLMSSLQDSEELTLIYEPNYNNSNSAITGHNAKVALIEATESGPYDIRYCLELCKKLRIKAPSCKIILMCSEQEKENIDLVVDAKGKKEIDDFVFFDVTMDYLVSKLLSA